MTNLAASNRSAKLARFISSATSRPLPDAVIEKTKHHILDTFAAILSGSEMEPGIQAIRYARSQGGRKQAGVLGSAVRTNAVQAALANGTAASLGLEKPVLGVSNTRNVTKKDMVHNDLTPKIEVDSETYEVRADGELLTCEPAQELALAQRYFLF